MDATQIALVKDSFAKVLPIKEAAADIFYTDLFTTAPEVKPLFAKSDMGVQGTKLMAALAVVVNSLNDLDKVVPVAKDLALRHVEYGVQAADYDKVGASLLRTLEKGLGDDFTPQTRAAWTAAYTTLAGVMVAAAYGASEGSA